MNSGQGSSPGEESAAATAARGSRAVRHVGGAGTLVVSGPDRHVWLNGLVTCDVRRVKPGHAEWGLALNRTGKIQSLLWILAHGEELWVGAAPGTGQSVFAELERMLVMEDAEVHDRSAEVAWACVVGPDSGELRVSTELVSAPLDLLGLGGQMLAGPRAKLESALAGIPELGDEDWLRLRLERGLVMWGQEFDAADRPHEAGLERRAVDWQKGCYLGQEVVCMQDMRGKVSRRLQRLLIREAAASLELDGQSVVASDGKRLGAIKSSAYSERAGGWLAYAMLPVPVGTDLFVGEPGAGPRANAIDELF